MGETKLYVAKVFEGPVHAVGDGGDRVQRRRRRPQRVDVQRPPRHERLPVVERVLHLEADLSGAGNCGQYVGVLVSGLARSEGDQRGEQHK